MIILIILACLVGIFLVGMAIAMAVFNSFLKVVRSECAPCEKTVGSGAKKALLIYHPSKHKSCDNITDAIADELVQNGYTVTINKPSEKISYNVNEYDLLVYGTAVYCGQPSTPLKEFVRRSPSAEKKVLLYSVGMTPTECPELNIIADPIPAGNTVVKKKLCAGQLDLARKWINETLTEDNNEV